ncbi:MAG TPA: AAA family ATPase [Candidatus Paceibacterota bacterium]|nr:AAA family ATPase [Candidatus Paceibacterota bacterium]
MTQAEALDILKMGRNVFLTGAAGSGKTHVLREFIQWLKEKNIGVAVTASTGIAATHLGGMTIHAWSGLGIRDKLSDRDIDELEAFQYLWKRYDGTQVLIIDEVSMLHHFRLDLLERLARSFKRNERPFGGMQVVICGDFFQLPPVSRAGEPAALFAYSAKTWEALEPKICYLEEQHRQSDDALLSILNAIRSGEADEDTLSALEECYGREVKLEVEPTRLSTHNENVDAINETELKKIKGPERKYLMNTRGKQGLVDALKKSCLAPEELTLKVGARVMFVKNNYERGYVNGTLGIVEGFDDFGTPRVRIASGKVIEVGVDSWKIEEEGKVKAEISQLPLRLAWAITVHKSQGMSLDAAEIDLSRSFAPGMGYVALSRVRTLAGLRLTGFNHQALQIHPEVIEKDAEFRRASKSAARMLADMGPNEVASAQEDYVARHSKGARAEEDETPTHHKTRTLIGEKLTLEQIAEVRGLKLETILSHIEKLREEGEKVNIAHLKPKELTPRKLKALRKAFADSEKAHGEMRLAPVKFALEREGMEHTYEELRLYRLFVNQD